MKKLREKDAPEKIAVGASDAGDREQSYVLRLYITGPSSVSARAVVNARRVCEDHLKGRYELEILNVADNVERATSDQVIAAPTLIKVSPPPLRRFIGDMSNVERLLRGLDVASESRN